MVIIVAIECGGTSFRIALCEIPSYTTTTNTSSSSSNASTNEQQQQQQKSSSSLLFSYQQIRIIDRKQIYTKIGIQSVTHYIKSILQMYNHNTINDSKNNPFQNQQIDAVGIASFGPIHCNNNSNDPNYGMISSSSPKQEFHHFNIVSIVKEALHIHPIHNPIPIYLDTDVNAPAMAEYIQYNNDISNNTNNNSNTNTNSNNKSISSCAYITVGTGVGVGLVMNHQPVHGILHPEMGHIPIIHNNNNYNTTVNTVIPTTNESSSLQQQQQQQNIVDQDNNTTVVVVEDDEENHSDTMIVTMNDASTASNNNNNNNHTNNNHYTPNPLFTGYSWGKRMNSCIPFHGQFTVEGMISSPALIEKYYTDYYYYQKENNNNNSNNPVIVQQQQQQQDPNILSTLPDTHPIWKDHVAYYLGTLCTHLFLSLSIERIVLGGGIVMGRHTTLLPAIHEIVQQQINQYIGDLSTIQQIEQRIVISQYFAKDAGLYGAIYLGQQAYINSKLVQTVNTNQYQPTTMSPPSLHNVHDEEHKQQQQHHHQQQHDKLLQLPKQSDTDVIIVEQSTIQQQQKSDDKDVDKINNNNNNNNNNTIEAKEVKQQKQVAFQYGLYHGIVIGIIGTSIVLQYFLTPTKSSTRRK